MTDALDKEFGLSLHIDGRGRRILFDTGNDSAGFAENVRTLGIETSGQQRLRKVIWTVPGFTVDRYRDRPMDLADASVVAAAVATLAWWGPSPPAGPATSST